jgi:outer membrane protein assembly factor BamB
VTAALDAKTGQTLWTRPRSSVFCGQLSFDLAHPVVCDASGEAKPDGSDTTGLDVTVVGIDPATGTCRWQAHVGAVQGLLHGGSDVVRTGDTTYTVRTPGGVVGLDLDRGIQKTSAADAGWCNSDASVTPG